MSENMRMYVEVGFNVVYLIVIWIVVVVMSRRMGDVDLFNRPVADRFRWAFFLLALGDTGHVGFRVVAYWLGGLEQNYALVSAGTLATAITVTLFYVIMLDAWRIRYNQKYGWFEYFLLATVPARFLVMLSPQNDWGNPLSPAFWGPFRNAFLIVLGLGVFYLYLREAVRAKDRLFRWIAYSVLFSYLFFIPVILFSREFPVVGMLMIPKTVMYVAIAFLAYYGLWPQAKSPQVTPAI